MTALALRISLQVLQFLGLVAVALTLGLPLYPQEQNLLISLCQSFNATAASTKGLMAWNCTDPSLSALVCDEGALITCIQSVDPLYRTAVSFG